MTKIELMDADGPQTLLWDVRETCRQLGGISRKTLERMGLASVKIGSRTFFRPEDVRSWIAARRAA